MGTRSSSVTAELPPAPWFARASKWRLRLLGMGVFLVVFAINLLLDFVVARAAGSSVIGYVVSDAVAAALASIFVMFSITLHNERREAVRRQLFLVAEMNHHVRNALDAIRMSAELTRDRDTINLISDEVKRIEWALREVLGREPSR
jgi:signal transduction histidine kinase